MDEDDVNLLARLHDGRKRLSGINALPPTAADIITLRHEQTRLLAYVRRDEEKSLPTSVLNSLMAVGRLCDSKIRAAAAACGYRPAEINELFSSNPLVRADAWKNLVALVDAFESGLPQPAWLPIVVPKTEIASLPADVAERVVALNVAVAAGGASADQSPPEWSNFRLPKDWRALLEKAGKSNSERTWSTLRNKHASQMNGDTKSVRITRALAVQWGLKLPEFNEGTSN